MGKKWLTTVTALGAVAFAAGIASATIPDSGGQIHACYKTENGQLRVTDSGACASSESPLSWNQIGPAGPAGPSGTLAWAHVAADGTVLGSSGNVTVARVAPGGYCVGVTGGVPHAAMAILDAAANVGGSIQSGVFFGSDCPSEAHDIVVETRPHDQDGGTPGADRAYYLVVS